LDEASKVKHFFIEMTIVQNALLCIKKYFIFRMGSDNFSIGNMRSVWCCHNALLGTEIVTMLFSLKMKSSPPVDVALPLINSI